MKKLNKYISFILSLLISNKIYSMDLVHKQDANKKDYLSKQPNEILFTILDNLTYNITQKYEGNQIKAENEIINALFMLRSSSRYMHELVMRYIITKFQLHRFEINNKDFYSILTGIIKEKRIGFLRALLIYYTNYTNIDMQYIINSQNKYKATPLIYAINNGHFNEAQLLIKMGANINIKDQFSNNALLYTAKSSFKDIDLEKIVRLLITHKADINTIDKDQKSILMHSIIKDHKTISYILIENNADINKQDKYGYTALMLAIANSNNDIAKALINHKDIDVDIQDNFGCTALMHAILNKNIEIIDLLLIAKADITLRNNEGKNALAHIKETQDKCLIESLIKYHTTCDNPITNSQNKVTQNSYILNMPDIVLLNIIKHAIGSCINNWSDLFDFKKTKREIKNILRDLFLTCQRFNNIKPNIIANIAQLKAKRIRILVENLKKTSKETYINFSQKLLNNELRNLLNKSNINKEILKKILELILSGADANIYIKEKHCTLLGLMARLGNKEILDILIAIKSDINLSNNSLAQALMESIQNDYKDITKLLSIPDIGLDIKDTSYQNKLLLLAIKKNQIHVIKSLLNQGINLNFYKESSTTLMTATQLGHKDIIELLIKYGVDINIQDKNGNTALMIAINNSNIDIVKLLIINNANINILNNHYDNALLLALKIEGCNNKDIIKLLIKSEQLDITKHNIYGNNALLLALENGYLDIAQTLIKLGINISACNIYNENALAIALKKKYSEIQMLLINLGAKLPKPNINNNKSNYIYISDNKIPDIEDLDQESHKLNIESEVLINFIINAFESYLNNWDDILEFETVKIQLDKQELYMTETNAKFYNLKSEIKDIISTLKSKRIKVLAEDLKMKIQDKYMSWSKEELNNTLLNLLDKDYNTLASKENLKNILHLIISGADINKYIKNKDCTILELIASLNNEILQALSMLDII